jgi:hypothetical protein
MRWQIVILFLVAFLALGRAVEIVPPKGWQQQFNTPPAVEKLFALKVPPGEFSPNLAVSRYTLSCCKEGKTSVDSPMRRVIYT